MDSDKSDLARIRELLQEEIPEASKFSPTAEEAERDREWLASKVLSDLSSQCAGGTHGLPESLSAHLEDWSRKLDQSQMACYCSAIGALFEGALLRAQADEGYIRERKAAPSFEVTPKRGSELAGRPGVTPEQPLLYRPEHIGGFIASRCGQSALWGELAWWSIARRLHELDSDGVFPGVVVERPGGDILAVRLTEEAPPLEVSYSAVE